MICLLGCNSSFYRVAFCLLLCLKTELNDDQARENGASLITFLAPFLDGGTWDRLCLVLDRLSEVASSSNGVKKSRSPDEANLFQCKRKLGDVQFTAAIKVLTSSNIAPSNSATLHDLEAKHPYAPPPILLSSSLGGDAPSVHKDVVLSRIHSFPKGTSCDRDRLRAQHFVDVLGGTASAVADDLLVAITGVVNLFLSRKCPSWHGLVSKIASSSVGNTLNNYLQDFQFDMTSLGVVRLLCIP
ncbi:hypothetical protein V2J09_021800 [Rumex salicifolius]